MNTNFEKRVIFDGVTDIYTNFMADPGSSTVEPVYETEVSQVPSLQDFDGTVEMTEKVVRLSNKEHDKKIRVSAVTVNINAAYFGEGVEEKAQGYIDEGDGAYSMPETPEPVPFCLRLIQTDGDDGELIWIFPNTTMAPRNIAGATRTEDTTEQIPTYALRGTPVEFITSGEKRKPYFKVDLRGEEASKWDRAKLLTQPIYNSETLNACKVVPNGE